MCAHSWPVRLAMSITGILVVVSATSCGATSSHAPVAAPSASAGGQGHASSSAADVTDYRGDLSRRGLMPGPGLATSPTVLWRYPDASAVDLPPAVVAGQVLVPVGASLVGLDLVSGTKAWEVPVGGGIDAPITVAQGTAFAVTVDGIVHAIDLATHHERWQYQGAADEATVSVQGGTAYLGNGLNEVVALDAATGSRRWAVSTGHLCGKIAIADGVAYVGGEAGGTLTAINLTSRKVLWTFETNGDLVSTPAFADGVVFVAGIPFNGLAGHNTHLYALDASSGKLIWRFAPPRDPPMASFAVGTHDVFIGVDAAPGRLYALDRHTGKIHWQTKIDGAVDRPALVGDTVYIAAGPGGLHAFNIATGHALWSTPIDGYSEGVVLTDGIALVAADDAADAPGTITALVAKNDPRATHH
jgi:outer membrane protein assembly factor BamB